MHSFGPPHAGIGHNRSEVHIIRQQHVLGTIYCTFIAKSEVTDLRDSSLGAKSVKISGAVSVRVNWTLVMMTFLAPVPQIHEAHAPFNAPHVLKTY